MKIEVESFGTLAGGERVPRIVITNSRGLSIAVLPYGVTLQSVRVPLGSTRREVSLGFKTFEGYLQRHPYFGVLVGRCANRIGGAAFDLDGITYRLAANTGANHLHGGIAGFDRYLWSWEEIRATDRAGLRFYRLSPHGEEGYPGFLSVTAVVSLDENDILTFEYEAFTTAPTVVNLTNHTYWNLTGGMSILDHRLKLPGSAYVEVAEGAIPTGRLATVDGPMDFRVEKTVGLDIALVPGGYDHCYTVGDVDSEIPAVSDLESDGRPLRTAARLTAPDGSLGMEVATTMPGVQFYSGNMLPKASPILGQTFIAHQALCLETQRFPDAVHHPDFESTILRPGERYFHLTKHRFVY